MVQAEAQQPRDYRTGKIERIMIAKREARLVEITRWIGPILQVRDDRKVTIVIGFIVKIGQNRGENDGRGRERRYP